MGIRRAPGNYYQEFLEGLVFDGQVDSAAGFLKQMASFFGGRLFTLIVEEAILAVFITWLGFNSMAVKLVAQVVVIVLNYVISKLIVFKK